MTSDSRSPSAAAAQGTTRLGRLAALGPVAESGLVVGAILALAVVLAPLAWLLEGPAGTLALAVAAGASLLAALFAVLVARLFHGPQVPMYGMLSGTIARMSVALAAVMIVKRGAAELAGAALVFYLLAFYLEALAIETAILIARIQPDRLSSDKLRADRDRPGQSLPKPAFPKAV